MKLIQKIAHNGNIIMNYEERLKILENLNCVDEIILQESIDPTQNLKFQTKWPPFIIQAGTSC